MKRSAAIPRKADRDWLPVAALALMISLLSLLYYFERGQILLYGDAVAHINIARRVFDSQTPGLLQLGTVWLPLPHLLILPFLASDWMWQSGVGGSIPSMIAFIFGAVGVFRLVKGVLSRDTTTSGMAETGGWVAALVYLANPNLLYLQTTAMTEPLYLALFVWAMVYLAEFTGDREPVTKERKTDQAQRNPLTRCALCLAAAELTRYDGWVLAAVIGAVVLAVTAKRRRDPAARKPAARFLVVVAIVPILWLVYNAAVYGNALEFANGKYSAKAIAVRTGTVNPAAGDLKAAAGYYLKAAQLNMAPGNWGRVWIAIAIVGSALILVSWRTRGVLLILWIPLIFYSLSIAYGSVPLFVPAWWPFSWYNLRYGLQLLPLFAVSAGLIAAVIITETQKHGEESKEQASRGVILQWLTIALVIGIAAASYVSAWRAEPLSFTEARVNSKGRVALESAVMRAVLSLPEKTTYLMYLGEHVAVFEQAATPLEHVVNEGNHRPWKRPEDPHGLWERALADPACCVNYVIAFDGDPVDTAVNKSKLTLQSVIHVLGQPAARIYAVKKG
jgi:hypothetical protein